MLTRWLRSRRLRAEEIAFWKLAGQAECAEALRLFERSLANQGTSVSKATRSAYHFLKWTEGGDPADLEALHALAAGMPAGSHVARAADTAQQMLRQRALAESLNERKAAQRGKVTSPIDPSLLPVERLAEAAATAIASRGRPDSEVQPAAQSILQLLPRPGDLPAEMLEIHARLFVWASFLTGNYASVCRDHARLREYLGSDADRVLTLAAFGWGRDAVLREDLPQAQNALDGLSLLSSGSLRTTAVVQWGIAALEQRLASTAAQWLYLQAVVHRPEDNPTTRAKLMLALAVALLQAGRFAEGRELIERLLGIATDGAAQQAVSGPIRAQLLNLIALSHLAATREWSTGSGKATGRDEQSDAFVRNRSLWANLHGDLQRVLTRLATADSNHAWRAQLLAGLIAFADPKAAFTLPQLALFAAAIEQVDSRSARERLKRMEGALATRLRAVDEAVECLKGDDFARLRELKRAVLDELGDAIPPKLRAAVAVALWNADPAYDPLHDLLQIPADPASETAIQRSIATVRARQTLQRLTSLLLYPSQSLLPSTANLDEVSQSAVALGQIALSLALLHRGDLPAARAQLPVPDDRSTTEDPDQRWERETITFLRFYVAWREGDLKACRELLVDNNGGVKIRQQNARAEAAVQARSLLEAIAAGDATATGKLLLELGHSAPGGKSLERILACLVARFIAERRPQMARHVLNSLRPHLPEGGFGSTAADTVITWTHRVLETLVAAQFAQYTVCASLANSLTAVAAPQASGFGRAEPTRKMLGWCLLLRIQAELGQAASTADQVTAGWRTVRRELESQSSAMQSYSHLIPYLQLMTGLIAYLGTDSVVADETIDKLQAAQQNLPLDHRARFIEGAVAQLRIRRQVLEAFWNSLGVGDFRTAQEIYRKEVYPALGDRTPAAIQIAMVICDWSCGTATTSELLWRIDNLRQEATGSEELIHQIEQHLREGETVRRIIQALSSADFQQVIEIVESTQWVGVQQGSMPVPVAIARLFAMYKLRKTDEAQRFASMITETDGLETWVKDYGGLLLGYIHFGKEEYAAAATAFARLSSAVVLGHDVDRYWAAAQFSQGRQLLAVNNKQQAFEAFASSLSKRGAAADNARLTPLFIHFGVKSIEDRNGSRAQHAFQVIADSLENEPNSAAIVQHRLLANMGLLLCHALMDEDVASLGPDDFLELLQMVQPYEQELAPDFRHSAESTLRRLALCQYLRREVRLPEGQRTKTKQLYREIEQQAAELEQLLTSGGVHDPVLLVLQALADLLFGGRSKLSAALDSIQKAMQLGIQSQRLTMCLDRHQSELKEAAKRQSQLLDLFDVYLSESSIPGWLRSDFVRSDPLSELYRLHRNYTPAELFMDDGETGLAAFRDRLKHLLECIESNELGDEPTIKYYQNELKQALTQLSDLEAEALAAEKEILSLFAQRLHAQSLEEV